MWKSAGEGMRCNKGIAVAASILTLLGGGNSVAEVLEEVVVTAQKREQSIQDVGIAVTALTGEQMSQLGYSNAQQVVDMTPGVQIVQPNSVSAFSYAIRGVIQSDFADHQEAPVSIYVDEAYVSQASGAGFMLFDLDRVEILRGPQGTLFGRNATGGLAHFITRKPEQELSGYAEAKFGSWSQLGFEGAVGGGLGENVAGRVSASMNTHDPYVRNRVGPDLNDGNEYAVRGQLLFDITDSLSLLVNGRGSAMEVRTGGADYEAAFADPVTGFGSELDDAGLQPFAPADAVICPGCDFFGFNEPDEDIFTGSFDNIGHNDLHVWGSGGKFTWELEPFTVVSITDWYHIDKDYLEDSDGGPTDQLNFFLANDAEQFSQEVRINGEAGLLRWVTGLYYLSIDGDYATGFEAPATLSTIGGGVVPANALVNAFGPGMPAAHPAGKIGLQSVWNTKTDSWSLFGQTEYDVLPAVTAILGFRWIEETKKHDYASNFAIFADDVPGGQNRLDNPNVLFTQFDFDKRSVDGLAKYDRGLWAAKAGLEWHATDETLLYASWNRGVKGGGFNAPLDPSTLFDPVTGAQLNTLMPFDEEILYAYEVGIKQELFGGLARINANAFYYDYQDFQAFIFEGLSQIVTNADSKTHGAELEFQASPLPGLDFAAGVAYLDAEVEAVDFGFGPIDRVPPRAPDWTVNGLLRYQFQPVFRDSPWSGHFALQADFNYRSDFNFVLTNAPVGEQPAYVIGNLRGSYTTQDGRWETAIMVKNVANQDYYTQAFDLAFAAGNVQRFIDRPRWVTGTIRFTWD